MSNQTRQTLPYISMGNWPQQAAQSTSKVTSRIRLTFHTYFHVTGKGPLIVYTNIKSITVLLYELLPSSKKGT